MAAHADQGADGVGVVEAPSVEAPSVEASAESSSSLARATLMTGSSQVATQALRFGTGLVLARLLTPSDFGVIAVAVVVTVFMDQLRDLGTGAALIQRKVQTPTLANTVFSLNALLGIVLAAGLALAAGPIASMLGQPSTANVLRCYGLITLVASLGQVQFALMRRSMRFGTLAVIVAVEAVIASAVSIGLAAAGWGPWSIAVGTLVSSAVSTGAVWHASSWRPSGLGSWEELRLVWRFSWNLFLANLVWFVAVGQADKAIIARALGLGPLGVYSFAQRAITYPLTSVSGVVGQVLYPALSRRQDDGAHMARILTRASAAVALLLLPAMVGLAAVADPLLPLVVGDGWDGLPLLVAVLAPAGGYQAVLGLANHVATAKGRPEITFRWHSLQAVVYIASFLIGLPWGITGVTIAYSAAIVVMAPGAVLIARRLTSMSLRAYYAALVPAFVASGLVALVARSVLRASGEGWFALLLAVLAAVTAYLCLLWWWRPRPVDDLLLVVRRRGREVAR